ncbi:hypothetical protein DQ04_00581130 [Trypanosoma grayi]|uniref:hypothetical protein n=1 Tax=Trypanosoma grayi TaxID=71804 RepID=UPI0004F45C3A|nr:hypothetical protein DQ04_00581130 [Trypanosoma grayi]KEG14195.1 hypothetical protein DQ04_00581130 [Trypanosoma grayi]
MSLQCEGQGAVCSACGHFDFLPLTCIRCQGKFCGEHINAHNAAGTQKSCVASGASNTAADAPSPTTVGTQRPRCSCVLCGSLMCVLTPCPICRRDYCAAHRFHVHEDGEGEEGEQKGTRRRGTKGFFKQTRDVEIKNFSLLCAQYTSSNALRLAPPSYRGSMIPVTALVWREEPDADRGDELCSFGVVSLEIALEMSIGQLLERLRAAHPLLLSSPLAQPLFHIEGMDRVVLRPIPLSLTVREATLSNRVVVFLVPNQQTTQETPAFQNSSCENRLFSVDAVQSMLTQRLFSSLGKREDTRLHAAAVHVRLQSRQTETASEQSTVRTPDCLLLERLFATDCVEVATGVTATTPPPPPPPQQQQEEEGEEDKKSTDGAPWPFQRPPPLEGFTFSHTRMKPLIAGEQRGQSVAVVVVAVFVADRLLSSAVPPFCIALSRSWSMGRAMDRIVQVVGEASASTKRAKWRLFDMRTQECLSDGTLTRTNTLNDGDVLFLGEQFPEVLHKEVARLQQLQGKAAAALKMKMMKTCAMM